MRICTIVGCGEKHRSSGLCQHHYNLAHYAKNSVSTKERSKKWRINNPDRHKTAIAQWRQNNAAKVIEYNAAYYAADIEVQRERSRAWHKANPGAAKSKHQKWVAENRVQWNLLQARRRARRLGADGSHTQEEIDGLKKSQLGKCAICRSKPIKLHKDHIIPLSKGGSDWIENIQLVCPSCNSSKKDKDPIQFAKERDLLL